MEVDEGARDMDRELIEVVDRAGLDTSSLELDLIASSRLILRVSTEVVRAAAGTNGLFLLLNPVLLDLKAPVDGDVTLEEEVLAKVEPEAAAGERSRLKAPVSLPASFDSTPSCFFFLRPNPLSIRSY